MQKAASSSIALLCVVFALSACGPEDELGQNNDLAGVGDASGLDAAAFGDADFATANVELGRLTDIGPADGPTAYDDLGAKTDSGICIPPNMAASCENSIASNAGCLSSEDCGAKGSGNGLDDNCNGQIDEGCSCNPGDVQRCFAGPPGKRNIGACTDGYQTCQGLEFGEWGPCINGISPRVEVCDKLDNDCNGCADDGLCCGGLVQCPASVPDAKPFDKISYQGSDYFKGNAASWSWTIAGGPCDELFLTTTGSPPSQSYASTGLATANPNFTPTLSGDYKVTMNVTDGDGNVASCTWLQHVVGPGVRFELCWDKTGPQAQGGVDLDLHVHKPNSSTQWFTTSNLCKDLPGDYSSDDCNYRNCTAQYSEFISGPASYPGWGYTDSPLAECEKTENGPVWKEKINACHNPRLDIDNVNIVGRPENINIDNPKNGETFRSLVHYFDSYHQDVEAHPIVNIYCGGRLTATYGRAPDQLGPCPGPSCFNRGNHSWACGQMWRVADVTVQVDNSGKTTGCTVAPIHAPNASSGYAVTTDNISF